jgi:hypothetical protein
MRLSLHYPVSSSCVVLAYTIICIANESRAKGTSWDLLHAYEYLLESLESAKKTVATLPDAGHLAVNINLGWMKLDEYYQYLNDSPVVYGAAALHPAYRWALFNDLWGDDAKRRTWILKAKAIVQDLWEDEYKNLFSEDQGSNLPASKRLQSSKNKFTAWRNSKRGLRLQTQAVDEVGADEYDHWQRNIDDSDALIMDPYEYWHARRLKYPKLSRMALDLLTVAPMSAECERLFSVAGQMVTRLRNRLDASTIGLCQTLRSWLREGLIGQLDQILIEP